MRRVTSELNGGIEWPWKVEICPKHNKLPLCSYVRNIIELWVALELLCLVLV